MLLIGSVNGGCLVAVLGNFLFLSARDGVSGGSMGGTYWSVS